MTNTNPFATALGSTGRQKSSRNFTEALANTANGSRFANPQTNFPNLDLKGGRPGSIEDLNSSIPGIENKEQQKKLEYNKKHLELHNKVNPVDQIDIFDARRRATKDKIEKIRKELKKLAKEISKFRKDIDITLMGRISDPGLEGIGEESFFDKLRSFIILLTQKVRSARTWAKQQKRKKRKQMARNLGRQMIKSSGHEQRASMDLFFNNERGDNWGE